MDSNQQWNTDVARQHYRLDGWSQGHFKINDNGNAVACIDGSEVDLYELSKHLRDKGISLPILVRFPQILQKSLAELSLAFQRAINSQHYVGEYVAAYPIKVNQQASVIQCFQEQKEWPVAFEVGSKAELVATLGSFSKDQTIVCNGYKDEAYIRLALMGCLLGHNIIIVIEGLTELNHVIKQSKFLDVQPSLGMRVRLSSIAKGNWQNTGGEHSKFGLTPIEVLELIKKMQEQDVLAWMNMLHFHMGSQIPSLQDIKLGLIEGMHYFNQLTQYGVKFKYLNIGGGLAVDYEGGDSNSYFSMDYSIQDYANAVIQVVQEGCTKYDLAIPTIVSENGRAMTAHHAVLITDVIDAEYQHIAIEVGHETYLREEESSQELRLLHDYVQAIDDKSADSLVSYEDYFNELNALVKKIESEFSSGNLSLPDKATADRLANYVYSKILDSRTDLTEEQRNNLEDKFIAKYFCNFSIFQSTPDIWGLEQIFPIIPLHHLDQQPEIKSRIYDLTCDSDGRIDTYVEDNALKPYISLHKINPQQDYVLGVFLVGAYQEILGDMHNLFGDTNAVNIMLSPDGSYHICDQEPGDTIAEILSYLHIDTGRMRQIWLDRLSRDEVSGETRDLVIEALEKSLNVDSYLN